MKTCVLFLLALGCVADEPEALDIAEATTLRAKAITRLRAAADYYDSNVRKAGGYAWHSLDTNLNERWGDARMPNANVGMIQSPGTADVALVLAEAAAADPSYANHKIAAAHAALVIRTGQLTTGGWQVYADISGAWTGANHSWRFVTNARTDKKTFSTFDDRITPLALTALMRVDALDTADDAKIAEAVAFAWPRIRDAQFAGLGGFPQGFTAPVAARTNVAASFPANDATGCGLATWQVALNPNGIRYWDDPTLNDNIPTSVVEMAATARSLYGATAFGTTFESLLDAYQNFLLKAQLPATQPLWAQQYDSTMKPRWARNWEMPAAAAESQDVMWALLALYQRKPAGAPNNRAAVDRALDYLEARHGASPTIDRYIELGRAPTAARGFCTKSPAFSAPTTLYPVITSGYSALACPGGYSNYGWKVPSELAALRVEYTRLGTQTAPRMRTCTVLRDATRIAVDTIYAGNRWRTHYDIEGPRDGSPPGEWLDTAVFVTNMRAMAELVRRSGLATTDPAYCAP
jgi:Pectic acid lyase